jgi:hypothetical protein
MTMAREPQATRPAAITTPRRRGVLTGTLAAVLTGATAVATAKAASLPVGGDDAELIRLADEIMAAYAESNRLSEIEDNLPDWQERGRFNRKYIAPLVDLHHELAPQLALMPATTLAGMRAKARFVQAINNCAPGYALPWQDDAMAWSLANDLLGEPSVWRSDEDEEPEA